MDLDSTLWGPGPGKGEVNRPTIIRSVGGGVRSPRVNILTTHPDLNSTQVSNVSPETRRVVLETVEKIYDPKTASDKLIIQPSIVSPLVPWPN